MHNNLWFIKTFIIIIAFDSESQEGVIIPTSQGTIICVYIQRERERERERGREEGALTICQLLFCVFYTY